MPRRLQDFQDLPNVVIRPSGVWNSRSPLQNYLRHTARISKGLNATSIMVARASAEARGIDPPVTAKSHLRIKALGLKAGRAWIGLKDAVTEPLTTTDLPGLYRETYFVAAENALLKHISVFETFVQCWALNYLLAKLERESGSRWTSLERKLALACWPIPKESSTPSIPKIAQCLPEVEATLKATPHVFTDRETGESVTSPIHPALNAWTVTSFWRSYRNLVVHQGAMVSRRFLVKHSPFYDPFKAHFEYVKPLQVGRQLELSDGLLVAVGTTHLKAALTLNLMLASLSSSSRGVPIELDRIDLSKNGAALLQPGDHDCSLQWACNVDYRTSLRGAVMDLLQGRVPSAHDA